ncbi:MAG: Fe(3+) ions import ATP-binding protein FbpC [Acidimicrobiaceae bacterium]|nr:MAG: Fe(3+) ions import ATP-binding protein FbpC [Acidimicrobiaceae bacterium]
MSLVLDGIDLEVAEGEVVVLLGPSGCGKSTLLRAIAGLERPSAGRVWWGDEDLTVAATHQRGMGLIFPKDHALFPHRDVAGNVEFGLRVAGMPADQRAHRVRRALDLVGLPGFGDRRVDTLSGGEAQRVALARSLAAGPRLLMLDEPLGSLDRALRERLTAELGTLLRRLGQAVVHVTHDHDEAFALADRIAVMGGGRLVRVGTPAEVWADPRSVHAARCLGHENLVDLDGDGGCALGRLGDGPGTVLVRGDRLVVRPAPPAGGLVGEVRRTSIRGGRTLLDLDVAGVAIRAWWDGPTVVGDRVELVLADGAVVPLAG